MPALHRRSLHIQLPWDDPVPPGLALEIPAWTEKARCTEVGGDEFYPEKGQSSVPAKQVCMGCEVRMQCLEWALDNGERFGVWGGKSERERRKIARDRRTAATVTEVSA